MAIIVKGGGGKPEEEKTVTAGTSVIEVNPSSGKVMKKVTVNPTPTESKSVTPTTSELTVTPSEGKHLSQVVVGAVEDVTPEVTAQTPVITQIAENLGVTITTPSGTNKQILQGNNANLLNIKNNAKKEGAYVWKKLTVEGGDFVDFAVSDSPTAYPDGGEQGGYWYEKMVEKLTPEMFGCTKMAIDKFTPTSNIDFYSTYYLNHSLGEVPKFAIILSTEFSNDSNTFYLTKAFNYKNVANCIIICANNKEKKDGNVSSGFIIIDSTQVSCTSKIGGNFKAGIEYTLITMA